jgi:uncharacterized protein YodC (DUF2158 family)
MTFAAGDIVILKSGGEPMTVIAVEDDEATCLWIGDDGDLFRENIPVIALQAAHLLDDAEDDESESETEASGHSLSVA